MKRYVRSRGKIDGLQRIARIATKLFVLAIIASLGVFSGRAAWRMYMTYAEVAKYANQAEKSYNDTVARKSQLEKEIAELKTPLGEERQLRKNYGLGKEGEGVYIFVGEEQKRD